MNTPAPTAEQLIALQQTVSGLRKSLDENGGTHFMGFTKEDIALLSWSLGVATAHAEHTAGRPWSRRRDAPAPGVGHCTCKASPDCPAHGAKS